MAHYKEGGTIFCKPIRIWEAADTIYGNASPRKTTKTFQQVYAAHAYELLDPMVLHTSFQTERWRRTSGELTVQSFRCLENLASPNSYSALEKYLLACYWAWQRLNTRPFNVSEYVSLTAHYELSII